MKTRQKNKVLLSISISFLLPLMASCGKEQPTTLPPDAKNQALNTVKVGYIPIAECAHLYVGINKKYFEQEGIRLELQPMRGGAVILPALQSGDLDIGFTNVVSVVALNAKWPPRHPNSFACLIGGTYERKGYTNHALLCKDGTNIRVSDLAKPGIKIAINTTKNIEELMLRRFLAKNGFDNVTLNLVPIGFPEMLKALQRGDVQVISTVEPFIEPAIRTENFYCLAKQYQEVSPNTIVATYGVTRNWLAANDDLAHRFIRAFDKANEFIKKNHIETIEIIGSFTRIPEKDLPIMGLPFFDTEVNVDALRELINEMKRYSFITKNCNLKPEDQIAF